MPFGPNAINPGYGQTQNNPTGLSNEVIASNPAQTPGNFVITGGSIDGTPIGITTPAAGKFTTLDLTTALAVADGGTGLSSTPTNGQLLIGNGSGYSLNVLTAGSGMSITNSAGTITLATTGGSGTVTSVNVSGGTTGLTFSGGPVSTSGTITMAGTLAIESGGTSATTAAAARSNLGVTATGADTTYAYRANNLSDLASAATARINLGLGGLATLNTVDVSTTATGGISGILPLANGGTGASTASDARTALGVSSTGSDTTYAFRANNLSDLTSAATARTNLGLGGLAVLNTVNLATTATGGVSGLLPITNGGTGASTASDARTALGVSSTGSDTTYAFRANNLSDLASAATARTNLGLGTIATQNANSVTITGGTINGTVIGGSTASAATFTTVSATDQFTSTGAWNAADGGGQIYLNGATGNRIDFASTGAAAPSTTTRSVGTRLVLSPALSSTVTDFAQGIDVNTLWFSVPSTSLTQFKWYGGTTLAATLTGAGVFSAVSIQNTPIGSTTANTGAFTTLSASSTVSGTGFTNYFASPPAIGSTAANTGAFTTLSASGAINFTGALKLKVAGGLLEGWYDSTPTSAYQIESAASGVAKINVYNGSSWTYGVANFSSTGLAVTGNVGTENTRPEFALTYTGTTGKCRATSAAPNILHLTQNLSYNGTSWNRDDTSIGGAILTVAENTLTFRNASSGANPATLTTLLALSSTGLSVTGTLSATGNVTFDTNTLFVDATNDRVGIGTTSPTVKLSVDVGSANADQIQLVSTDTSGSLTAKIANGSGDAAFGVSAVGDLIVRGRTSGKRIRFDINSSEKACIDSSGNLGIGTATPQASLDIYKSYSAATDSLRFSFNDGSSYFMGIQTYVVGAGNVGYKFRTNNASTTVDAMAITGAGLVGIGTTSPSYKLHVSGTGADVAATDSTVTTRIIASSAGAAGFLETTSNHPLIFRTNQVERARITTAGNIVAGASAALATTATDGFLYVPTCAGTPTGTPTAITGMAPIVVNTTNNKLYFYSGGAWRDAGP